MRPSKKLVSWATLAVVVGLSFCNLNAQTYSSVGEAKAALKEAQSRYSGARQKKSELTRQLDKARSQLRSVTGRGADVGELDRQIFDLQLKLLASTAQKDAALAEMRAGMFCSGCGQTRSEILAKGEQFPHEGQYIIAATPEQLAAAAAKYDAAISEIRNEIERLSTQRATKVDEFKRAIAEAQKPVRDLEAALANANQTIYSTGSQITAASNAVRLQEQREAIMALEKRRVAAEDYRKRIATLERDRAIAEMDLAQMPIVKKGPVASAPSTPDRKAAEPTSPVAASDRIVQLQTQIREAENSLRQVEKQTQIAEGSLSGQETATSMARIEESQRQRIAATNVIQRSVGPEADSFLDRQTKTLLNLAAGVAESNKERLKNEIVAFAKQQAIELQSQLRPDLEGLPLYDPEGSTPDSWMSKFINDEVSDAASTLLGHFGTRSKVMQTITDYSIKEAGSRVHNWAREKVISVYNSVAIESNGKAKSSDPFERAEDAVWKAAGHANLLMRTGGVSITGYRQYMEDVQQKFFEFLDLAPDALLRDHDSTETKTP